MHVECLFDRKIKAIQTDWGGEYRSLHKYFSSLGILHHLSRPHTYEQNGTVKRKHRHLVETGLSLLAKASVPQCYWQIKEIPQWDIYIKCKYYNGRFVAFHCVKIQYIYIYESPHHTFAVSGNSKSLCFYNDRPLIHSRMEINIHYKKNKSLL